VINYLISELGVTDQRIIGKVGFLSGKLLDRDLATIEEIRVTHGALGRALGYGSLLVRARGKPELRIDSLLDPEQFRQAARGQSPENARDGD
jgi:hypothetical protein